MTCLPMLNKEEITFETNTNNNCNQDKKNKIYDYFQVKISKPTLDALSKLDKDKRYVYFLTNGVLRRFEGEGEVLYIEIPQIPNNIVVYRRPMNRNRNKEKLHLNKKSLPHIPLFEGEESLKFLSLESNVISKIDHLISLNNLLFLNLYENKISEIDNLSTVPRLKALMLGKNTIDKIKNLSFLQDLEVLDLHSNRIKLIENLENLKRLKVLNLANNQITSFGELMLNKKLEDLNLRKNLIVSIPNMTNSFEKIRTMNLGKNMIAKLDFILELKKLKLLEEVYIEENPVLFIKDSYDKLITFHLFSKDPFDICSKYKTKKDKGTELNVIKKNSTFNGLSNKLSAVDENKFAFGTIAFNKHNHSNISNSFENYDNNLTNEERSLLLFKIRIEWEKESKFITDNGFNGYNIKKLKETKIQYCHAELKLDKQLNLFGNAIEVLDYSEFYGKVHSIQLQYFNFDIFTQTAILSNLKKFSNLKALIFMSNNIHSLYQLIKLEDIKNLEYITINDNEINASGILRYFLIYRIQTLKFINDSEITSKDIALSKTIFEKFDLAISCCEEEKGNSNSNSNQDMKIEESHNENKANGSRNDTDTKYQGTACLRADKSIGNSKKDNDDENKHCFMNYLKKNFYLIIDEIIDS